MSQTELYGREMTFGMVGVLGQEWGSGSDLGNQYSAYSYLLNYNYEQVVSKALIDAVWNKMYEGIANVNTLIQYSDLKREVLGDYYGVVRGEALAYCVYLLRMILAQKLRWPSLTCWRRNRRSHLN